MFSLLLFDVTFPIGFDVTSIVSNKARECLIPSNVARIGVALMCYSTGELLRVPDDSRRVQDLLRPSRIRRDSEP